MFPLHRLSFNSHKASLEESNRIRDHLLGAEKRILVIDNVKRCARCGKNHTGLLAKAFTRPPAGSSHFVMCPNTDEPILVTFYQKTE